MELALPNGDRPLHIALINENERVALFLLERGADFHALASNNRTSLHIAADYNLPSIVSNLLDRSPATQIEHVDDFSWTPLCSCGHVDIVELLIEHGANVHYTDKDGWTPLHQAVQNDEIDVALALIAAGAKLEPRTADDGLSVLERATHLEEWCDHVKKRQIRAEMLSSAVERRQRKRLRDLRRKQRMEERKGVEGEGKSQQVEEQKKGVDVEETKQVEEEKELEGLGGEFELVDLDDD
jgi:Rad3-related DNA helicase